MKYVIKHSNKIIALVLIIGLIYSINSISEVSKNITEQRMLDEAQQVSETINEFRSLYTSEVVSRLQNTDVIITHDYLNKENAIPLPATLSMHLGKNLSNNESGNTVKLYSPFPFPHRAKEGGLTGDFSKTAWKELNQNPSKPYYEIVTSDNVLSIKYAVADVMRPSCVNCHNTHINTPKKGWKVGDVRGILEVNKKVDLKDITVRSENILPLIRIIIPFVLITLLLIFVVNKLKSNTASIELKNIELNQKSELLKNTNSDLNNVSKILAHDLKTPIRGMISLTEHIEEDIDHQSKEETLEKLQLIRSRSELMDKIIDGFRKYIQLSNTSNSITTFSIIDIVNETVNKFNRDALIEFEYTDETLTLNSDQTKIQNVLTELISNAIVHNNSKSKKVLINVKAKGDYCVITIIDNGSGVSKEYFSKILEPLHTLESKYEGAGIGMGLATVRKSIDHLKGTLEFDNQKDGGLEVTVKIPLNLS